MSARGLLSQPAPPTAIVAMSDIVALGSHSFCGDRGIHIPNQVSLAGFDDIPESALVTPALSTVSQAGLEKGKKAGEILCSLIHKRAFEAHVVLEPQLVIRGSAGVVRSSGS